MLHCVLQLGLFSFVCKVCLPI